MNNKALLISVFTLLTVLVYAQPAAVQNARTAYMNSEFFKAASEAVTAYERVSPKNKRARKMKSEMAYIAARSYEYIFNNEEAENWYQRCIDLRYAEYEPDIFYRIASIQRQNGEYEKAKENYQEYLQLVPIDKRAETALASLEKAEVLKDNRTRYNVKNEMKINTEHMEMATSIGSRRGDLIVFGTTRNAPTSTGNDPTLGEPYFNLWQVEIARDGNWMEPQVFQDADSINTEANEGTVAFDGRFRKMFLTRCPNIEKKNMGCQIWVSERRGRAWGIPVRVTIQEHDSISVGHPCPTEDGKGLIFASDRPGGLGGMDLWYTEYDRRAETWTEPVNLGEDINTAGDELFPTFALNGDLFFASNGLKGLGGLDIFRAEQQGVDMRWKNPTNMGTPLNSDADDFHLTERDKRNGFFSSNRRGAKGTRNMADIWSYELPPNIFDLKVIVNEIGGDDRIGGATVEVTSEEGSFKGVTNSEGTIFWDKNVQGERFINEEQSYEVKVLPMEGYHESNEISRFTTVGLEIDQNFIVEMGLIAKTPIVLPEVRYDLGSAVLQVKEGIIDSRDSLNFVDELLNEYPGMVLKLISHTDSRGSSTANEKLAQARAESCVRYLVDKKGVNPERLIAVGRGENEPRKIYLIQNGDYVLKKPTDGSVFEEIVLTERYINQFKRKNKDLFERLHQYNRRTEAEVVRMDWKPGQSASEEEAVEGTEEGTEE
jgi:outer membrane protein OmpA-like peptidoglycan-associated protein